VPRRLARLLVPAIAVAAGGLGLLIGYRLAGELAAGANAGTLALELEQPAREPTTLEQLAPRELAAELLEEAHRAIG